MKSKSWTPVAAGLPWDAALRGLRCPGCPNHVNRREDARYELVLDGVALHGDDDHHDALRVLRRSPDFASGPFDVPALPEGMPAVAVIDFLERQTFDRREKNIITLALRHRFPSAVVHAWAIQGDIGRRIAEDAYWDPDSGYLIRSPVGDIAPHEYPSDVGWDGAAQQVDTPNGQTVELTRGCLYVDPMSRDLVRYGWVDLPGPLGLY